MGATPVAGGEAPPRLRFLVIAALWVTAVFLYLDRVNISLAAPFVMRELGLSGVQTGLVLGVFSWGFIFGHVAGGFAADRLNIRAWCSGFFLVWCVATVATGFGRTLAELALVRAVFGFAEGAVANPMNKLQNHWVFPAERGIVNGTLMCAAYLGLVVGSPLVGWMIAEYGWRSMFFLTGAASLAGVAVFWLAVRDHPHQHPWISALESAAIEAALARDRVTWNAAAGTTRALAFRAALRILVADGGFWCISGAFFFLYALFTTNFSWLPGYLVLERGFSGVQSGNAMAIPYGAAAIGALGGGWLSDRLGTRCGVVIGAALLTIPAIAGLLLVRDQAAAIAMLAVVLLCNTAAVSLFVVMLFDLFPPEVTGVALAITVGICGGLGGVAGPLLMGLSLDLGGSFMAGFVALAGGLAIAIVLLALVWRRERAANAARRERHPPPAGTAPAASSF